MKKAILIFILVPLFSIAFAQENKKWPTTKSEAIDVLVKSMDNEFKHEVTQSMYENLAKYNFSWGGGIRNDFGLRQGNNELLASCGSVDMTPDDASSVIIEGVWEKLRSQMVPETRTEYEKIETAIRGISIPPCDSKCQTIGQTIAHFNNAITLAKPSLSGFEIVLDNAIQPSEESYFNLKERSPLSLALARLEFQLCLKKHIVTQKS